MEPECGTRPEKEMAERKPSYRYRPISWGSSFSLARRALHPSLPETLVDAALAEEDQS